MCAKWKTKKFNIKALTKYLNDNKLDDTTYNAFEYEDCVTILSSAIEFDKNVKPSSKLTLLHQAINSTLKNINKDSLLKSINIEENKYLSKPLVKYIMFTSISIITDKKIRRKIGNTAISINGKYVISPKIRDIYEKSEERLNIKQPEEYSKVKVFTDARCLDDAFQNAIDSVDILRGIWNLLLNMRNQYNFVWGKRKKGINRITWGPIHVLGHSNYKIYDRYWYESDYTTPSSYPINNQEMEMVFSFEKKIRKSLKKHRYKNEIEDVLIKYTKALDSFDDNNSFLKLWSLLEVLTDTTYNNNNTIKRVLFIFKRDIELEEQRLIHLREYRNHTVHTGNEKQEILPLLYQLKKYVELLLIFHIENKLGFSSLSEASYLLEMPTEINELSKKLIYYKKAIKYKYPHLSTKL